MTPPPRRPWRAADTTLVLLLAALATWMALQTRDRLNYQWDWRTPFSYLVNIADGGINGGLLLDGFLISLRLMMIGGLLALLLGGAIALLALSPLRITRMAARFYVESLRHLPPIVFMFVFFYFISAHIIPAEGWRAIAAAADNSVGKFLLGDPTRAENLISGALCLAVFEAAFVAEIIRAGILAVAPGQSEAARALGLSAAQTLHRIIFPQALSRIAAPLAGQLVLLVKDSAILSVISVQELTFSAQETAVSTQQIFETWLIAALLYFIICAPLLYLCGKLEHRRAGE